jgi:DNA-binding NarL/FixJ family response regulator
MIRLLLVDDHASFRELLMMRLQVETDIDVVEEAGSLQAARELLPGIVQDIDVVLLDLDLPDGTGSSLIPELLEANPNIKVIVLTASADSQRHADSMSAGAVNTLFKDIPAAEIVAEIRKASAGGASPAT